MSRSASPGWHTTDEEEIAARRERAAGESFDIVLREAGPGGDAEAAFGDYDVSAATRGRPYFVEIRSLTEFDNACECKDYLHNGLGTCKHIEAVLHRVASERVADPSQRSARTEVFLSRRGGSPALRIAWPAERDPGIVKLLNPFFTSFGDLVGSPLNAIPALQRAIDTAPAEIRAGIRVSMHVWRWGNKLRRTDFRDRERAAFVEDLATGKQTGPPLKKPLYPYQREGMIHLAFGERALLADEMGLGKTVQAIAAAELLVRRKGIERVLVICPASLKAEWTEQIDLFTDRPHRVLTGNASRRETAYRDPVFYTLATYEQVRNDSDTINDLLLPDLVILDEAQRIKNWNTKTARAVKHVQSPFAFVLTGTPLENRIDEVYSIAEFLDPQLFGPLFRFNREFYQLNDAGRPVGFRNLPELHRRISSIMVRRRKDDVEDELPDRTVNNYFVAMTDTQRERYEEYETTVARLAATAGKRGLSASERGALMAGLACMRMLCDSPGIIKDATADDCPKLDELEALLDGLLHGHQQKALLFSEWVRMLDRIAERLDTMGVAYARHTGAQSTAKRREAIERFREDPECRVLLSSDTGSTGLNLQVASIVINFDLPWNPAKLEQRIARAWRKAQTRSVTVINLVALNSIEHRMLARIASKQALADAVLDGPEGIDWDNEELAPRGAFLRQLNQLVGDEGPPPLSGDALRQHLAARLGNRLLRCIETDDTLLALVDQIDAHVRATLPDQARVIDAPTARLMSHLSQDGLLQASGPLAELLDLDPAAPAVPETREETLAIMQRLLDQLRD